MALTAQSRQLLAGMAPQTLADAPELIEKLREWQKTGGPNEVLAVTALLACIPEPDPADKQQPAEPAEPQASASGEQGRLEALRRFPQLPRTEADKAALDELRR
jgi:hypothetical protein